LWQVKKSATGVEGSRSRCDDRFLKFLSTRAQEVLHVHVPHYCHMFEGIMAGPRPWRFGHVYLPGGSEALGTPAAAIRPLQPDGRRGFLILHPAFCFHTLPARLVLVLRSEAHEKQHAGGLRCLLWHFGGAKAEPGSSRGSSCNFGPQCWLLGAGAGNSDAQGAVAPGLFCQFLRVYVPACTLLAS
jgi:hypothetical protein